MENSMKWGRRDWQFTWQIRREMGGASGDECHFFCCGLCLGMISRADEGVEDHRDIRGPCLTRSPPRQGATEITFEVRKISTGVSIGARVTWSEIKGKGTPAAMDSRCAQLCRRIRGVAGWCLAKIQSFRTQAACKRPSLTARRGSLRMSLVAAKRLSLHRYVSQRRIQNLRPIKGPWRILHLYSNHELLKRKIAQSEGDRFRDTETFFLYLATRWYREPKQHCWREHASPPGDAWLL